MNENIEIKETKTKDIILNENNTELNMNIEDNNKNKNIEDINTEENNKNKNIEDNNNTEENNQLELVSTKLKILFYKFNENSDFNYKYKLYNILSINFDIGVIIIWD